MEYALIGYRTCSQIEHCFFFYAIPDLPDVDVDDDDVEQEPEDGADNRSNASVLSCDITIDEAVSAASHVATSQLSDVASEEAASAASSIAASEVALVHKMNKRRKRNRIIEYDENDDEEEERSDEDGETTPKLKRRRWSSDELDKLFAKFGQSISSKSMPPGRQIAEFAQQISNSRSVMQVRTQIHNIIQGKVKGLKGLQA